MELNDSKVFSPEYFSGLVTFEFHERTKDFILFKKIQTLTFLPNFQTGPVVMSI